MTVLTATRNAAFSRQLALPFGPAISVCKTDTIKPLRRQAPQRATQPAPPGWLCQAAGVPPGGSAQGAARGG